MARMPSAKRVRTNLLAVAQWSQLTSGVARQPFYTSSGWVALRRSGSAGVASDHMKSGIHASTTGHQRVTHVADCANCRQERWAAHERTLSGVSPYRFQEQTMARISRYT